MSSLRKAFYDQFPTVLKSVNYPFMTTNTHTETVQTRLPPHPTPPPSITATDMRLLDQWDRQVWTLSPEIGQFLSLPCPPAC